jgi:hypothetical protein
MPFWLSIILLFLVGIVVLFFITDATGLEAVLLMLALGVSYIIGDAADNKD